MSQLMNFGKAIRIARSIGGHTQRELAELAGVDPSLVSMLEKGARQPSTSTLHSISEALEIPLPLLMMLGAESNDLKSVSAEEFQGLSQAIARLVLGDGSTADNRSTRRGRPAR